MADDTPLNINPGTVARFAAGGALGGAAIASALNLVHMLRAMNEDRKLRKAPTETDESTIVLTVPRRKTAEADCSCGAAVPVKRRPAAVKKCTTCSSMKPAMSRKQVKHHDGQFGHSVKDEEKKANWQTLTAAILAMGGAGTVGYMVADKIYNRKRIKNKEKELQGARQEYLDLISRNSEKTAAEGGQAFNMIDYPLGAAALALLLGGGATAWLTKRILDEYDIDRYKDKNPKPEVKRIVFKSASELEDGAMDKDAADTAQALVAVYLDVMSGSPDILGDPACAVQLKQAGVTSDGMYKMAAGPSDDYYSLIATLDANPELRKILQRLSMEKHPVLKHFRWAVGLPGVKGYADKKLYAGADEMFNSAERQGSIAKAAAMLPLSGVLGGLTGSAVLGSAIESGRVEQKLKELQAAIEAEKAGDEESEEESDDRDPIDVLAADPGAAEFLARNQDKIRAALAILEQQKRI